MPLADKKARAEYGRQWYQKNKPKRLEQVKRYYGSQAELRKLVNSAKQRASLKGLEFDLIVEDLTIPEVCPILGQPLVKHTRYAPSIDRKDSSKGYVKDNVWIISRKANTMKSDANAEDLRRFAQWVLNV